METLELAADLKGCRDALDRCKAICDETSRLWDADARAKDATISRLREYAWHKASCDRFPDLPFDCTCGYDELLAALEEAK